MGNAGEVDWPDFQDAILLVTREGLDFGPPGRRAAEAGGDLSESQLADAMMRTRLLLVDRLLERLPEVDADALISERVRHARLNIREVFRLYVDTNGLGQRLFDVLSGLLEAPAHERRQLLERRIVEAGVVVQAAAVGPRRDPRAVRMGQTMLVTLHFKA
jgi:hypothetical protein